MLKSKIVYRYKGHCEPPQFTKHLGIYYNGTHNLYPETIEGLIDSSPSALQCTHVYKSFLQGQGFDSLQGEEEDKTNKEDLLDEICYSLCRHSGAFIHIHYDATYKKTSFEVLPFYSCRVGIQDSKGFSPKIYYAPKGWGASLKREDIVIFDNFNPKEEAIEAQVKASGGWRHYKGQIKLFSLEKGSIYPRSLLDSVYLYADLEAKMALYYSSMVNRGFEDISFIRHLPFDNPENERKFHEAIREISELENASSKILVEDDWREPNPKDGFFKIDTLASNIQPDKYQHFEKSAANYIRKAFKNIPSILIDYLGGKAKNTSVKSLQIANKLYNIATARDRKKIERLFEELLGPYEAPGPFGVPYRAKIKPNELVI